MDVSDFFNGTSTFAGLTDALSYVGYAMTFTKLLMQAVRTGDFMKAVNDHKLDLMGIGFSIGGKVAFGAAATMCNVAAFILLMHGTIDSIATNVDLMGAEDKTEYGYRAFTTQYLTYVLKENRVAVKYGKNEYQKLNQL